MRRLTRYVIHASIAVSCSHISTLAAEAGKGTICRKSRVERHNTLVKNKNLSIREDENFTCYIPVNENRVGLKPTWSVETKVPGLSLPTHCFPRVPHHNFTAFFVFAMKEIIIY